MSEIFWQSPYFDHETVLDGAERFVREAFGVERKITWTGQGEFRFADGYHCYRIDAEAGYWVVRRTAKLTPKAKARAKARRAARLPREAL